MLRAGIFYLVFLFILSCKNTDNKPSPGAQTVFEKIQPGRSGINFKNELLTQEDLDVFRYRNFYNGGGVGIADFDNDGLSDIYLISNMHTNKLYRNLGNWKFEEITDHAGVGGKKPWSTGVSIADVNNDGWLDIYVSNAGDVKGGNRENELFINNHDLTFTEEASKYGLNDKGFTTHAVFFDYDKDGDLDCYVLNNSYRPVSTLGYRNLRDTRDEFGGHKLYNNENNHFIDVSEKAGIFGSVIGFGLGVSVGDVNQDGWPDLYISNDFYERDYLYINDQHGGFDEEIENYMGHISMFSMGSDLADLNNDGYPEIFTTDMLPEKDKRLKTLVAFETYDVYQLRLRNGYYHQFMRNMLHLNTKDGNYLEIGEIAGVSATDWSWGALIADFNNDRYKEIFVANGIYKDVIDQDFVEYFGSNEQIKAAISGKKIDFQHFVDEMPSVKLSNYLFERQSDLRYKNKSKEYGLDAPSFSNGAAYGDLDNDGDLDLVVNNVNQELFLYRNNSQEKEKNNFLSIRFAGSPKNNFGVGAIVKIYFEDEIITNEHMPNKGFQSSMDYKMIVGIGQTQKVDSLIVVWPDDKVEVIKEVKINSELTLNQENATKKLFSAKNNKPLLKEEHINNINHVENKFNDFDRDRLLYSMLSTQGPAFSFADLNLDQMDDIFIGGSAGFPGMIYRQEINGQFTEIEKSIFETDSLTEDVGALFFDADGDEDMDLYVVTGGTEYTGQNPYYLDRFYLNAGSNSKPNFQLAKNNIPNMYQSGSCVRQGDFDNDGDVDLFVGTRVIPAYYGLPCDQYVLENNGSGVFTDVTDKVATELRQLGMVTDAYWTDLDSDGWDDLIIVGEWMPITIFKNSNGKLSKTTSNLNLAKTNGWWNSIHATDIDNDGDMDFILGNNGLNSKFQPTIDSPIKLYVNDFDKNGSQEPIFAFVKDGIEYPMALRQDIIKQMSSMKKKFVYFKDYADKSLLEIFDQKIIDNSTKLNYYEAHSSVLINKGSSNFELQYLPIEAQVSPVFGMASMDLNNDNRVDLVIGGNLFNVKPEIGRYDALKGLVLLGNGMGQFEPIGSAKSGLHVPGENRHIEIINRRGEKVIAFIQNNIASKFYTVYK